MFVVSGRLEKRISLPGLLHFFPKSENFTQAHAPFFSAVTMECLHKKNNSHICKLIFGGNAHPLFPSVLLFDRECLALLHLRSLQDLTVSWFINWWKLKLTAFTDCLAIANRLWQLTVKKVYLCFSKGDLYVLGRGEKVITFIFKKINCTKLSMLLGWY